MKTLFVFVLCSSYVFGKCPICEKHDTPQERGKSFQAKCEACGKPIPSQRELAQVLFAKDGVKQCKSITVGFSINPDTKVRFVCKDCLAEWAALVRPSNMFVQQTFDSFVQRKSRLWDININGKENSEGILQNIDKNHLKQLEKKDMK